MIEYAKFMLRLVSKGPQKSQIPALQHYGPYPLPFLYGGILCQMEKLLECHDGGPRDAQGNDEPCVLDPLELQKL